MPNAGVFDFEYLGKRLKEIRHEPALQPEKPYEAPLVTAPIDNWVCSYCGHSATNGVPCKGGCLG